MRRKFLDRYQRNEYVDRDQCLVKSEYYKEWIELISLEDTPFPFDNHRHTRTRKIVSPPPSPSSSNFLKCLRTNKSSRIDYYRIESSSRVPSSTIRTIDSLSSKLIPIDWLKPWLKRFQLLENIIKLKIEELIIIRAITCMCACVCMYARVCVWVCVCMIEERSTRRSVWMKARRMAGRWFTVIGICLSHHYL